MTYTNNEVKKTRYEKMLEWLNKRKALVVKNETIKSFKRQFVNSYGQQYGELVRPTSLLRNVFISLEAPRYTSNYTNMYRSIRTYKRTVSVDHYKVPIFITVELKNRYDLKAELTNGDIHRTNAIDKHYSSEYKKEQSMIKHSEMLSTAYYDK
jgi:hypothetical protein